ncbi:hypothetical protein [Streptomyces longwoodensis]|uniref:hypothetical protein n=1 Tax=Streptomyces longwoodensis TaxID=68231 RepID=UPI0036FF96BE
MAFPEQPLGLRGELRIGTVWQNITGDLYTRSPITHKRGRPYRSSAADPATCTATIRNITGDYTPRNPEGKWYGQFGRNTPFRISVPGGPARYLNLTGAPDLATTPDVAALDITGDLDLRWEGEADWYAKGAQMLIGKWGAAGNRSYNLRLQDGSLLLHATTDGTFGASGMYGLPQLPRRAALRATVDVDNGAAGCTFRFYWAPSIAGPWTQIGSDLTFAGAFAVFAGSAPLSIAPQQVDTIATRYPVVAKCYRAEVRNGINGPVVAAPDFTARPLGKGGTFTDSAGRVWTLAPTAEITDRVVRVEAEVSEWPPEWSASEKDAWTAVTASGILRRLGQGAKPLQSTLRRRIPSASPLAYWPMEDGATSTQAASALDGGTPLRVSGLTFGSDTSMPGADALPVLGQSSSLSGTVRGAQAGGWHAEMVYKLDKLPATEQTMLSLRLRAGTGGVAEVRARVSTSGVRVQALDAAGDVVAFILFSDPDSLTAFTGVWNRLSIFSAVSGGTTYVNVGWRNVITNTWWYARTAYTGTPGTVLAVSGEWGADFQGMALGHLAVWDIGGTTAPAAGVTIYAGADDGFNGETAAARMQRLCREEGVPLLVEGDVSSTARMGPQRPAPLLELLRECAAVDGGVFGEVQDRRNLWYRTRTSLYSQAPKLTLDYAAGHIADPFKPVEDDQVRNAWEITRRGGSSGIAVRESGPLSVQDPPAGIGLYQEAETLTLYSDEQTTPTAAWRLALSTWDEARYPSVTLLLHRFPELIPYVLSLQVGDKIRIVNLPRRFAGASTVDLLVDGWAETLLPREWTITLNCAPAGPWQVARIATYEDFEDTTYAVPIAPGGNLSWVRTQTRYNSGTWSLRSGAITNNQTSDAVVTLPAGTTELRFWYRVSSEPAGPGFTGDRFVVLLDGVQAMTAQGEVPWSQAILDVTGKTTVTFRYIKDNSAASGEDAAFIDDLLLTTPAPYRADTAGSQLATGISATATQFTVTTTTGPRWTTDPVHLPFDVRCGGEVMRVTAISGTTTTQTFTVVRSVNGVVKAQTAGTAVSLAQPAAAAL